MANRETEITTIKNAKQIIIVMAVVIVVQLLVIVGLIGFMVSNQQSRPGLNLNDEQRQQLEQRFQNGEFPRRGTRGDNVTPIN